MDLVVRDAEGVEQTVPINTDPATATAQAALQASIGATSDAVAGNTGGGSVIAFLRRLRDVLPNSLGQKVKTASLPVVLASDQDAVPVKQTSSAADATAVSAATSATTLQIANAARRGASVYYDGAAVLYLILGDETPTSSLYTLKMGDGYVTYFEVPAGFTGKIAGIWSAAVGSALVTEIV